MTLRQSLTKRQKLRAALAVVSMMQKCDSNNNPKCFIRKALTKREQNVINRELELLDVAEKIMAHEGFSGLTMDKLVAACDYSKGTVYNHFANKEDLFCALSIKGMRFIISLVKRAVTMQGNSREKCLAIVYAQQLHSQMHATASFCVLMVKTPAVLEKASVGRIAIQRELDMEITLLVDKLIEQAADCGDLTLNKREEVNGICFALWSMSFGSSAILASDQDAEAVARLDMFNALLFNMNVLLDGLKWLPLSDELDYQATWLRIGNEVFAAEVAALS
ncbi:TetR/AcrR family transcriptional regulator [Psychrobium sp. nBUS_13]|uniref:TetR/AcrR family transcriptional regulator n=1 Tax=Psychrobium sp. nBUS_13 TaxID=3395319 RepID=UPI003EBFFD77